jgi:1-acyl-sn-glycerol-3-phosphate acyltransferase
VARRVLRQAAMAAETSRPAWQPSLPGRAMARLARHAWRAARESDGAPFDPDRLDRRDPAFIAALEPDLGDVTQRWLNLHVEGHEHLTHGPRLYVANHNGGIMGPDLFCTLSTLWRQLGAEAPLYAMAHDFAMRRLRPLGRLLQRVGAMRASRENAARVLERGGSVLVYPGGDVDAFRHFGLRHRVVFGRRSGFVRIAQQAGVPIVPIVAQGAHQSAIIFHEGEWLARTLGLTRWSRLERFPIALALPWGIAPGPWMPYAPMPFPIRLRVLPPTLVPPERPPERVRDAIVSDMQAAMDEMTAASARA